MNNAERNVFQTVSSVASREKRAKNKASFRFMTFYRMTMAAMLGRLKLLVFLNFILALRPFGPLRSSAIKNKKTYVSPA